MKNNKGFALAEIMIASFVLFVLGAIAVPVYINYIQKPENQHTEEPEASQTTVDTKIVNKNNPSTVNTAHSNNEDRVVSTNLDGGSVKSTRFVNPGDKVDESSGVAPSKKDKKNYDSSFPL